MSQRVSITRSAWILLGLSTIVAGVGFAPPRLRPVPAGRDPELTALRGERDALAASDDATLESLRQQSKEQPQAAWSAEKFAERVGTGWRVEWQQSQGTSRVALLSRSAPRLHEWPNYLCFIRSWTTQPGIVLESLEVTATGPARARELGQVVISLRVSLIGATISDAERAAPSHSPLPVAPAAGPAAPRKIGPVSSLRRPSASAEPPAPGPASTPFRPDPPGPSAGISTTRHP